MKRGFTLVELLVVIVIIGILSLIAVFQYRNLRIKAYNSTALYDLKNLVNDEISCYSLSQEFVAFSVRDISKNGTVKVGDFVHKYISAQVKAVVKVSSSKEYANFCTKHFLGNKIYGYQTETGLIYSKESFSNYELKDSDCPDATPNDDFAGWKVLAQAR